MSVKLSVIIPIYNAERTIETTVKSVMSQDYTDFELILVNDGSKDGSAALIDGLAANHTKIRVIHKLNGGVSSARNAGIEAARGEYITFVDADDMIDRHMFTDMMATCQSTQADKVFCGHDEVLPNGKHIAHIANLSARTVLNREEIIHTMLLQGCKGDSYMNSVCGGGYRTYLLRKYNLRFENRPMGEDWLFNMKYCSFCQTAVYIDQPYYKYLRNAESAVSRYQPQQFELWLENRTFRRQLSKEHNFNIDSKTVDAKWITKVLFYALEIINQDPLPKSKLHNILNHEEFTAALNNVNKIYPPYFVPIAWLIKKGYFNIAYMLLRVYALRLKH